LNLTMLSLCENPADLREIFLFWPCPAVKMARSLAPCALVLLNPL
jgi:hypothetical protein